MVWVFLFTETFRSFVRNRLKPVIFSFSDIFYDWRKRYDRNDIEFFRPLKTILVDDRKIHSSWALCCCTSSDLVRELVTPREVGNELINKLRTKDILTSSCVKYLLLAVWTVVWTIIYSSLTFPTFTNFKLCIYRTWAAVERMSNLTLSRNPFIGRKH